LDFPESTPPQVDQVVFFEYSRYFSMLNVTELPKWAFETNGEFRANR